MGKIFVLIGKSGVGKSTIQKHISRRMKLKNVVSYTTRPPRENEQDGVDYHFVTDNTYNTATENNELLCSRVYNTEFGVWKYGISTQTIDLNYDWLCVVDCKGYRDLISHYGKENVIGIYVTLNDRVRLIRTLHRCDGSVKAIKEIHRRYDDDTIVFVGIENEVDFVIENVILDDTEEEIYDFIEKVM